MTELAVIIKQLVIGLCMTNLFDPCTKEKINMAFTGFFYEQPQSYTHPTYIQLLPTKRVYYFTAWLLGCSQSDLYPIADH